MNDKKYILEYYIKVFIYNICFTLLRMSKITSTYLSTILYIQNDQTFMLQQ